MSEPRLHHLACETPDALGAPAGAGHRMAWWEWNETGDPRHPHVVVCVHGLTRQGRDFDTLARALAHRARVVCPDVAGRGRSDWLAEPAGYAVPTYAEDMRALLAHLAASTPGLQLDWVGTSMGGLIGLVLFGQPARPAPAPLRRLVLNDVGPALQWPALQRIGAYLGRQMRFATREEGAAALRMVSAGFGPHTVEAWAALSAPMLVHDPRPGTAADNLPWRLHYDPRIGDAFLAADEAAARRGEDVLWRCYDTITAPTLLLRGAESDLLASAAAAEMATRGPRARCLEFAGVGHAPTLVAPEQVQVVRDFLLGGP